MDADKNKWKESVGFQINYRSDNSDDDDDVEVVMRNPRQTRPLRHSDRMLADEGDGSEADQLGTTPPRERIRLKRRGGVPERALSQHARPAALRDHPAPAHTPERTRRLNHKTERSRARDDKLGGEQAEPRADSLPSPDTRRSHVPTLWGNKHTSFLMVESCSRFMSLTSRLKKCRGAAEGERAGGGGGEGGEGAYARDLQPERRARGPPGAGGAGGEGGEFPPSRVSFYQTFSMLINMGNIDKGCRRMMSREEQVWQNELKDLIWLELQARIAGRSLAEQDAFLCAQRDYVPAVVSNIRNYRFVNTSPCCAGSPAPGAGAEPDELDGDEGGEGGGGAWWCASLECGGCARAVGKALRELGTLLDSYQRALQLYPSERAMTADHPLVATNLFKNRLKAMCLWYNTAMHLRLKVLAVRRMIRTMKLKSRRRHYRHAHLASTDSDISRQSWESPRACTVRFNVSDNNTPSSSSNSAGASHHSDDGAPPPATHEPPPATTPATHEPGEPADGRDQCDSTHQNDLSEQETSPEGAEPSTPEIVISDARYDTADTAASSESGYTSAGDTDSPPDDDVFDIGSLSDVTELRLLDRVPVSIYRSYHQEMLKTQGVRRCMTFINKMRNNLLHKVYLTLEKPDSCMVEEEPGSESEVFDDARDPGGAGAGPGAGDGAGDDEYELRRFGCWSEECRAMRLPSYRGHFLLLCTVCLEVVHDYLALRLEDRPDNPSALTVKQLIHELKEGLDIAADMRAAFARHVHTALAGRRPAPPHARALLLVLRTFDRTVDTVLEQYLSYLRTVSRVEQLPRGALQAEWAFTARLARRVACALRHAPTAFAEIACNQLDRVHKQLEQKFEQLKELDKRAGEPDKNFVYSICRAAQQVYAGERDATLHAAHWARSLAARLARDPAHIHRRAGIFNSLMSIRDLLVAQTMYILERSSADIDESDALGARVRELMLQIYRLGFELHKELYKFAQAPFQVSRERRRRPASLQPARRRAGDTPTPRRPETMIINQSFNPLIHKELHRFVHDSPRSPCARRSGAGAGGAGAGARLARSESVVEDGDTNVFEDTIIDNVNCFAEKQSSIELFLLGESARCLAQSEEAGVSGACEGQGEGERGEVEERRWAALVARAVVEFAHCWMTFVVERCETGRGLRPRWASQGLEFLMLACDPCNTSHLSEEEFEQLKHKMDACISHVIGARRAPGPAPAPPRAAPAPAPAPPDAPPDHKPHTPSTARRRLPRSPLPSAGRGAPPLSASPAPPAPPTPPTEPDPLFHFPGVDYSAHSARVSAAARRLDEARARRLGEARAVGRVLDAPVHTYEPKLRQLQFKWQRGLKIGAGSFGKVYTVVNTETGQLLAMKEIALGAGDRRALQRAANELRVLEGVIHPHLVRYYGCELHREEMLLFMELCVEGSLEALLATAGALQEHMVRRYTKQLLSAVCELHARGIAHRDIKSGNIFLTNEGHCLKLGDFGCAVKIRANTTAAGELKGHVGTQAYMAPEVFMKPTGHGRAADVWSLGCVVTEMASGKRPFSEYDSNVQIMFVVGMGGRPAVPDALSAEGRAFCLAALTHEPAQRPAANELQLHHFLMLKADDDCQCEPAFLIT